MATQAQIDGWIADVVELERTRLGIDHPRHLRYGGGALAETRKRAQNGRHRLENNGAYPGDAEIRRRAEGGISIDDVRRQRAAEEWSRAYGDAVSALQRALNVAGDAETKAAVTRALECLGAEVAL